jgi:hypothetical protein
MMVARTLNTRQEAEDKLKGGVILDLAVRKSEPILHVLLMCSGPILLVPRSKEEPLESYRYALHLVNLLLDIVDGIGALNLKHKSLSCKLLDEDLHQPRSEAQDEVEIGSIPDVIIGQSTAALELLPAVKEEALLGRVNAILIFNGRLEAVDGICALNIERPLKRLDGDFHPFWVAPIKI